MPSARTVRLHIKKSGHVRRLRFFARGVADNYIETDEMLVIIDVDEQAPHSDDAVLGDLHAESTASGAWLADGRLLVVGPAGGLRLVK
jgi:hypothetical protein